MTPREIVDTLTAVTYEDFDRLRPALADVRARIDQLHERGEDASEEVLVEGFLSKILDSY